MSEIKSSMSAAQSMSSALKQGAAYDFVKDLSNNWSTANKVSETLSINDAGVAIDCLGLYYVTAINYNTGEYYSKVYPSKTTPDRIDKYNGLLDEEIEEISMKEVIQDPIAVSEKIKTIPYYAEKSEEKVE